MGINPKVKICRDCGIKTKKATTAKRCVSCGGFLRVFREV